MLLKQNPPSFCEESNSALHLTRMRKMNLMSFPGHSSYLCLSFIRNDLKTFIVLDNLPCGLQ